MNETNPMSESLADNISVFFDVIEEAVGDGVDLSDLFESWGEHHEMAISLIADLKGFSRWHHAFHIHHDDRAWSHMVNDKQISGVTKYLTIRTADSTGIKTVMVSYDDSDGIEIGLVSHESFTKKDLESLLWLLKNKQRDAMRIFGDTLAEICEFVGGLR